MGVNKWATNFATLSELGRFPLHFDIIKSMIRYWYRLENLDSNFTLLKDAYEESKKLFEIKIPSWYGSITLLIKNIRGLKELSNVSKHKFKSSYKDVIYQVYKENWGKQMLKHSEGKLCNYSKSNSKQTLDLTNIDVYWNPLSRGEILLAFVFHHTNYKLRGGDIRVLSDKSDIASVAHLVR